MRFLKNQRWSQGKQSVYWRAAVRLCRVRLGQGIGGKGVVIVAGDVGAVNAAVKAATDANESLNLRITEHYVIPNPDPELLEFI